MRWIVLGANSQILAVHAALVAAAGKTPLVLYFGGDEHDQGQHDRGQIDHSRLYDCNTGAITNPGSPPASDLFCCGHSLLADGRVITGGGTNAFPNEVPGPHNPHFPGLRDCWSFNPVSRTWSRIASMNPEPGRTAGGGRWYPTLVTLSDGRVLIMSGHPLEDDTRHTNNSPEIYSTISNAWSFATGSDPAHEMGYYPRLHVLPNGEVFCSTPLPALRIMSFNPGNGTWRTSVLLPLRPSNNYRAKILLCGGVQPVSMDMGAATLSWTPTAARTLNAPNPPRRRNLNAVLLPSGEVFICGGVSADSSADSSGVLAAEMYNPTTNTWATLPTATVVRNYHSVALLLPDGRIWTGGGNKNAAQSFPAAGTDNRELRIELFEPWYYGRADRPHVAALPDAIHCNEEFKVRFGAGENISQAVLIRAGSSTHAFNGDQRLVELNFTRRGGNLLQLQAPPNSNIAPPGNYLLFLLNAAGVPSEGKFISMRMTPAFLVSRVGDFDGDGISEILVSSPWGIGILKRSGTTMIPLMMAPNGTRFGGWLLNTADNRFGEVADYDGDSRPEVLVTSPWGIGILKLMGNTMTAPMMQPNGTRFGGWLLNTADNDFGPAANYDGGTQFEILVKSPWGIGILKQSGNTMIAIMMQPNGTRFGGWLLNTADNNFGPAGDFNGDGHAEIVVTSPWGMGILKQGGGTMSALMMAPNGTRFGAWLLNTFDNEIGHAADFDGDGRPEIFIESPWGIGILKFAGGSLISPIIKPNGTRFGGWLLNTMDNRFGAPGNFIAGSTIELFVTSPWGIGILQISGTTMNAPMMQPNGTRFGGWLLNTADNVF
jgi:hypothetical protein